MSHPKTQSEIYDARKFDAFKYHRFSKINRFLPKGTIKLLDIGCGEGQFYDMLKQQRKDIEYSGLDVSSEQVERAKSKGYRVSLSDVSSRLPFEDETFDVVVCFEIIEHVFDTDFLISEMRRVLVSGGKLLLTTPNIAGLGERLRLLFGKIPSCLEYRVAEGSNGHIRAFNIGAVRTLLTDNKFDIVTITGREFYTVFRYGSCLEFVNFFLSDVLKSVSPGILAVGCKP